MSHVNIEKTCAICKYANHDPSLGDREDVICTLKPSEPKLVPTNDTCLRFDSKYKNIKIIQDAGTLLEYDPATKSDKEISEKEYEDNTIEDTPEEEVVGEEEVSWQL